MGITRRARRAAVAQSVAAGNVRDNAAAAYAEKNPGAGIERAFRAGWDARTKDALAAIGLRESTPRAEGERDEQAWEAGRSSKT